MARSPARRRYATGVPELDEKISQLIAEAGIERHSELIGQIIVTGLLLARDGASRLDVKIINAALKEMRYAFKIFAPYRDVQKVSVFGSARSRDGDPDYEQAREFGRRIAERGWMVVTGAGPGSMEAANAGAGAARSFGVNIRLPFEAEPNPFIAEDPKLINFKYFFTRKLMFIKEAEAFVLLPGGFGTMDEAFELLTLTQTGKSDIHPIVLLDRPGGTFWRQWLDFIQEGLFANGYISEIDLALFKLTDDVEDAVNEIDRFYRNYHSMRYVQDRLVLRMKNAPGPDGLADLGSRFADIVVRGGFEVVEPSKVEIQDDDAVDLQRVAFTFDRTHFGRLRQLIDHLNDS
ncbi:MAG TPA: TIGR00730 family Rossman fold protein [Actinomycetota bacterium]|nr:TIGR00730 family Rossman fold protein [Actinomycetota bacterium]